jgi:hypothetical protein
MNKLASRRCRAGGVLPEIAELMSLAQPRAAKSVGALLHASFVLQSEHAYPVISH